MAWKYEQKQTMTGEQLAMTRKYAYNPCHIYIKGVLREHYQNGMNGNNIIHEYKNAY